MSRAKSLVIASLVLIFAAQRGAQSAPPTPILLPAAPPFVTPSLNPQAGGDRMGHPDFSSIRILCKLATVVS